MDSPISTPVLRKRKIVAFRGRGAIYSWLRAHAGAIEARLKSGELTWPVICAEMVRHGIAGRGDNAPTPNAALRVWSRVSRDLEAEKAAMQAQPKRVGATPPSRISKDWRPSGFRLPSQSGGNPTVQQPASPVAGPNGLPSNAGAQPMRPSPPQGVLISPDDPPEVREKLLKIEASLQQADWFLGQPKRRTD